MFYKQKHPTEFIFTERHIVDQILKKQLYTD